MEMEVTFPGGKKVNTSYNGFTIETDLPEKEGGKNSAPTPSEYFLASIGACAGLYALGFCEQRNYNTRLLKLNLEFESDPKTHMIKKIIMKINLPPEFPQKYVSALIRTVNLCYVKKHLEQPPEFDVKTIISG